MEEEQRTIMIVEDEEDLSEMYKMALTKGGFEVIQAWNGVDAFRHLKEVDGKVDMILLDIIMPEMDGMETLGKLKEDPKYKDIPVIMTTNLDSDADRTQAADCGVKEYFVKSQHTPSELVEIVRGFLSKE